MSKTKGLKKVCMNSECRKELENWDRKFCSKSCSATYHNKIRLRNKKRKPCRICGKEPDTAEATFCRECIDNGSYAIRIHNLKDAKTDSARRRFLIRERGHKCEDCSNEKWNGKEIPLELEHIDGNSTNNEESNLKLLCPNCHALTPTYKGRNKGRGRFKRKERARAGKSF